MIPRKSSYSAAHVRVREVRGRASDHPCVDCDGPACDWSYDYHPDGYNSDCNAYSMNPEHYSPRCRRCHKVFDGAVRRRRSYGRALSTSCPRCGASPGEWCMTTSGRVAIYDHAGRRYTG